MGKLACQQPGQRVSPPWLVVDVADQGILDRDPATGRGRICPRRRQYLGYLPAPVHWHELIPQAVVGSVQGHREPHRQALAGQPPDGRDEANGGHGDPALGNAKSVGHWVSQAAHGPEHVRVVGQWLAHAHEHHIGDPAWAAGNLAAGQRPGSGHHLRHDLGSGEVPGQPGLAGRAERAGHPAARL